MPRAFGVERTSIMSDKTDTSATAEFFAWLASPDGGRCREMKEIGEGLYAAIKPMLFHWTLKVGEIGNTVTYLDRWCYADQAKAEAAIRAWDGSGEPTGWHRHPYTGRRRDNGDPSKERVAA
jgi:hypothetical protein